MKLAVDSNPVTPDLTYKNHRFHVSRVGKGWRAMIYAPGSSSAFPESPANLEASSEAAIIAEAKWIVDARCTAAPTR